MGLAILLLVIGTSLWVYFDATKLGVDKTGAKLELGDLKVAMGPVGWLVCCLLLWIVAFPVYLIMRPQFLQKSLPPGSESPAPSAQVVPVAPLGQATTVNEQVPPQATPGADVINTEIDTQGDSDEKKAA